MIKSLHLRVSRRIFRPSLPLFGMALATALGLGIQHANAQAIDQVTQTATGHINNAAGFGFNSFCYIVGGSLFIIAIWKYWQHSNNPNGGSRLGIVFAATVAGGILVSLPSLVGTTTSTLFGTSPGVDGSSQMMRFDK